MDKVCPDVLWSGYMLLLSTAVNGHLTDVTDTSQSSLNNRSKTNKATIPITADANGEPEIPSVVKADGYYGKVVQSTLRAYCTAHIRESITHNLQFHVTYIAQGTFPERRG